MGLILAFLFCLPGMARADCSNLAADVSRGNEQAEVKAFYYAWGEGCAWKEWSASELLERILRSEEEGIDPSTFDTRSIRDKLRPSRSDPDIRDLLLTRIAISYARAMQSGRVDLASTGQNIALPRRNSRIGAQLAEALKEGSLAEWLASLPPSTPEYKRLKQALAFYKDLASRVSWPSLGLEPGRRSVKPGEVSPSMPAIRERLLLLGDLHARSGGHTLNPETVSAVIRFQFRHGLERDGIVGPKTLAALNVSPAERAEAIALNMERYRIMFHAMPPTRVEVNAAGATAALYENGVQVFGMRTIVGKPSTPTPILSSFINKIILNPPWVIPRSIYVGEIAPAMERDPDYLAKHDMFWEGGQLVQRPGPKNSLGRLKFEFASPFAVYLHDTNAPSLFARDNRFLSHGCIRLEKPLELAAQLLGPSGGTKEEIEAAIAEGETKRFELSRSMPVVVAYWTAFASSDGVFHFRDDIYGRDAALAARLRGESPPSQAAGSCGS